MDNFGNYGIIRSTTGDAWKTRRKSLNHTVQHYSILNSYSPIFDDKIKILIDILKAKDGKTFNIYNHIEAAAAEIVCSNYWPRYFSTSYRM